MPGAGVGPARAWLMALLWLGALSALAWPSPALAQRLEPRLWLGAGLNHARPGAASSQLGAGAQLGLSLALSDFWGLQMGLDGAYHMRQEADDPTKALPDLMVSDAFVAVQYTLDVLSYVPHVSLGLVGYLQGPPTAVRGEPAPDLGARLNVGLHWRATREWSLGGNIDLHASLLNPSDFNLYTLFHLNVGYHWGW